MPRDYEDSRRLAAAKQRLADANLAAQWARPFATGEPPLQTGETKRVPVNSELQAVALSDSESNAKRNQSLS